MLPQLSFFTAYTQRALRVFESLAFLFFFSFNFASSFHKAMAPKTSKVPKASKLIGPAISPKVYIASTPSVSEIARDYLFPEDILIHAIEEIHSDLPPTLYVSYSHKSPPPGFLLIPFTTYFSSVKDVAHHHQSEHFLHHILCDLHACTRRSRYQTGRSPAFVPSQAPTKVVALTSWRSILPSTPQSNLLHTEAHSISQCIHQRRSGLLTFTMCPASFTMVILSRFCFWKMNFTILTSLSQPSIVAPSVPTPPLLHLVWPRL